MRFGDEGRVCFLGQLDATVEEKGEGGEVTLAFAFHGPVLDQALEERGDMPLPPYIAARPPDERDRNRLPDLLRAGGRLGRRADRGTAFHRRELMARLRGARCCPAHGHAACGRRDVSAGQGRRHRRAPHAPGVGQRQRGDRGRAQRGAARRRPHRRRRLDFAAAPGKRGGDDGVIRPFAGETALFITPGYRFRAVDVMLTNFHLPRSTLFMLVAAFCGLE